MRSPSAFQVTFEFPPLAIGGIGSYAYASSYAMAHYSDWALHTIAAPAAPGPSSNGKRAAVWEDSAGAFRAVAPHRDIKALDEAAVADGMATAALHVAKRFGPPTLIHCQETKAFSAGRLLAERFGVPLVCTVHSTERARRMCSDLAGHAKDQDRLRREMVTRADIVIAVSRSLRSTLRSEVPALAHVDLLPGTAIPELLATGPRAQDASHFFTLGFVGRLAPEKGVDLLPTILAAASELRPDIDFRLLVAGAGRLDCELREESPNTSQVSAIQRLGYVQPSAIGRVYRAADVLLVPSRSDSFPLVIVEAQAVGTPVIAARVGGVPEAIRDGVTGLLVPPQSSPLAWAAQIERLLDCRLRSRLAIAARRQFEERFSPTVFAEHLTSIYSRAV